MSLNLYQRHRGFEPIMNNTYYDDHGNTIYTVHTPFSLSPHRTTTISKAIHDTASGGGSREASPSALARRITVADEPMGRSLIDTNSFLHTSDDEHAASLPGARIGGVAATTTVSPPPSMPRRRTIDHNFVYVAQIDWKVFRSSKIRFGTGQYSGLEIPVKDLFRKEGWGFWGRHRVFIGEDGQEYRWNFGRTHPQILVATFHQERLFSKNNTARLEIFPPGQHMIDEIFVTSTYIERLRRAKERIWMSATMDYIQMLSDDSMGIVQVEGTVDHRSTACGRFLVLFKEEKLRFRSDSNTYNHG
ncbi:MAG: hypothetical protein NXY57DRAFT_1044371 [Lentinula lateritia]|uniref:DUF6593 domain-containing protein n=1 Tax=Lentinula lateritia TaxID=40482 RepID=A0ABQ8V2I1_9AGAR|nr:MAG: hypothetical protein NXY57DRAFT_1044371 [Lentinula lateritia]KAJ4469335.1 hypothetical protein C8R41DRAFT_870981 [Lentinula lateritia]